MTDNLRSVVAVVNAAGTLVERVVYDPFGKSQHHFAGDINGDGVSTSRATPRPSSISAHARPF